MRFYLIDEVHKAIEKMHSGSPLGDTDIIMDLNTITTALKSCNKESLQKLFTKITLHTSIDGFLAIKNAFNL